MKNKKLRSILQTAAMLIAAALIGGIFALFIQTTSQNTPANIEENQPLRESSYSEEDGIGVARRILPSVVGICCSGTEGGINVAFESTGSGVIIDERGYIVTNHHVIEDAEKISIAFSDGSESDATLKIGRAHV